MEFIARCRTSFTKQRSHILYVDDKSFEGTALHASCLKLYPESQDYQTPKEDHNAQKKASGRKNLMVEKYRTLPSFALITHFYAR